MKLQRVSFLFVAMFIYEGCGSKEIISQPVYPSSTHPSTSKPGIGTTLPGASKRCKEVIYLNHSDRVINFTSIKNVQVRLGQGDNVGERRIHRNKNRVRGDCNRIGQEVNLGVDFKFNARERACICIIGEKI